MKVSQFWFKVAPAVLCWKIKYWFMLITIFWPNNIAHSHTLSVKKNKYSKGENECQIDLWRLKILWKVEIFIFYFTHPPQVTSSSLRSSLKLRKRSASIIKRWRERTGGGSSDESGSSASTSRHSICEELRSTWVYWIVTEEQNQGSSENLTQKRGNKMGPIFDQDIME